MKIPDLLSVKRNKHTAHVTDANGVAYLAQKRVSYMLRRLALDYTVDGTLEAFGSMTGIHVGSLSRFVREGRVPQRTAEHIEKSVGRHAIRKEQLMYPMEYEDEDEEDDL